METKISLTDPRHAAAMKAIEAMHEFWKVVPQRRAVQWIEDTSGNCLVFTRGEYRDQMLMALDFKGDTKLFESVTVEREGWPLEDQADEQDAPAVSTPTTSPSIGGAQL